MSTMADRKPRRSRRDFTDDFKASADRLVLDEGKTVAASARDLGLLGFAEYILTNAARLWMEATAEQRPRLQRALFPEGLRLRDGKIGTAVTCMAFTQLGTIEGHDSDVASPTGFADVGTYLTGRVTWRRRRARALHARRVPELHPALRLPAPVQL